MTLNLAPSAVREIGANPRRNNDKFTRGPDQARHLLKRSHARSSVPVRTPDRCNSAQENGEGANTSVSDEMNIVEPLRTMLGTHAGPERWTLPVGPGRWQVLFGGMEHPLLLPAGDYRQQRRCLAYFVPGGWKAVQGNALLLSNAAFPAPGLLPEFRVSEGARSFLSGVQGLDGAAGTAIRIGTTNRHQKASVLPVTERGEGLALAKLAMVPGADHQVTAEAAWLRALEAVPELEHQVPRVLAEGVTATSRRYLVTTLAPTTRARLRFTSGHIAFLGALGRATGDVMSFTASPCFARMEQALERLEPNQVRRERATLSAALQDCRSSLSDWTGPFVTAHGDFAPWNIRIHGDRIFVFDWERARAGANPLADAFNYFVMPRAACGRGLSARFMAGTLERIEDVAQRLYPEWIWRARVVSALGLAYLLEALLERAATARGFPRGDAAIGGCLRLLEERSAWVAA